MIKTIIRFFRNYWEKEINYEVEFEFSIYDLFAIVGIIALLLWWFLK